MTVSVCSEIFSIVRNFQGCVVYCLIINVLFCFFVISCFILSQHFLLVKHFFHFIFRCFCFATTIYILSQVLFVCQALFSFFFFKLFLNLSALSSAPLEYHLRQKLSIGFFIFFYFFVILYFSDVFSLHVTGSL